MSAYSQHNAFRSGPTTSCVGANVNTIVDLRGATIPAMATRGENSANGVEMRKRLSQNSHRLQAGVDGTPGRGALPTLLRAFVTGQAPFDASHAPISLVEHALERGLGPIVAHVVGSAASGAVQCERLRAADLTARALAAERYAGVADLIAAARDVGCPLVLLKGTATALRYYPAPHLRTTGDVDVLVPKEFRVEFETRLRRMGLSQRSSQPGAAFEGRHHSMPFWHPDRNLWIDVHSALIPRQYPLAGDARFSWPAVEPHLTPISLSGHGAYVMPHELQLVYTCVRWAERFDRRRGMFPMLDAALVIHRAGASLDWDRVLRMGGRSWAATALHVMLSWLDAHALAPVPREVRRRLARADPHVNALALRLLDAVISRHVVEGQSFGSCPTEWHVQQFWTDVLAPRWAVVNLLCVPFHVLCPPRHPQRLNPLFALRRLNSFVRRVARARAGTVAERGKVAVTPVGG